MFKKILIGVILLVLVGSVVGCSCGTTQAPNGSNYSEPEGPGEAEVAPSLTETPPVEDQTKNSEKVVAVPEFIEKALNGEYNEGDVVLVSGIVTEVHTKTKEEVSANPTADRNTIFLGPRTLNHVVRAQSESVNEISKSEKGHDSFVSMMKVKVGDRVTVKGTMGTIYGQQVFIRQATVQ